MDSICQDLGIPRKQIKETKTADRFLIVTHKSWLKCLLQNKKVSDFPIYSGSDDWAESGENLGHSWTSIHLSIYKKYNHKVIPLPHCREENIDHETSLYFSHLLQYISQTNHQNLWKHAYKKYSAGRSKTSSTHESKKFERSSVNLVPYNNVLREVIGRTYGCSIVHAHLDKIKQGDEIQEKLLDNYKCFDAHANLYPVIAAIESNTHFIIVFSKIIENNLLDCVTYSPAIMAKSHNKPLFLIYQLLQLTKTLHSRGLLLGNVGLGDIYLTENLWLNVMPRLDANILQFDCSDDEPVQKSYVRKEHQSYSLKDYCEMWCNGQLSNFDYLTILNNLSGRSLGCPGYHHIMPWVTDFVSRNGMNWRDLKKSKYRLNKGDAQLDFMFSQSCENDVPHHVSDVLSEITYYVYMARRTQKNLLCKHVRPIWVPAEYPASIQRLQEWTPDECIPEFFSDPLVFKSVHEDLPDLEVPVWASCPEDFITKHREALESQYVSERIHHWIDLNFGYKLTGAAAIKAKNVCLPLVNEHKTLCDRGIVQLFTYPHPPKQYQTPWTSKTPPRIYSQIDSKRRLTRSSEDLSNHIHDYEQFVAGHSASPSRVFQCSPKNRHKSPNQSDDAIANMERSTSYHANVQKSQNQIILPKDYNPVAALCAVENMEVFLSKTFYHNLKGGKFPHKNIDYEIFKPTAHYLEEGGNSFTNRMFAETYEANFMKDSKRLHNLKYKNRITQNSSRNYKHIITENRFRELQVIGCIIVEIFLAKQLRPLGSCSAQTFDERIEACLNVLKYDFDSLPKCVQYPVKLLLQIDGKTNQVLTEKGLPQPSPNQILQPLLNNFLFPFPFNYIKVYTFIKSLVLFDCVCKLLEFYTFFDCDGKHCDAYETFDKTRVAFMRKIAECKVKSCVIQIEALLQPIGYEQFNPVELILPHAIDLLKNDETSILVALYLFDSISIALGPKQTSEYLLEPILHLYETDNDDNRVNSNVDSSMKFATMSGLRSRKTIRLYHHTFLQRLIVRFGLKRFLDNFVSPLIEAVGGYKEPDDNLLYHYHDRRSDFKKSRSTKNFKYCSDDGKNSFVVKSVKKDVTNPTNKSSEMEEMFSFESEVDDAKVMIVNMDDSSDNEAENAIMKIIDQFDLASEGSLLDLRLNHSTAEEATEYTPLTDRQLRINDSIQAEAKLSGQSFDEDQSTNPNIVSPHKTAINLDASGPKSPTIPIPTFRRSTELSTIDCEIGSKKSVDSNEYLIHPPVERIEIINQSESGKTSTTSKTSESRQIQQNRISEMSAESLIWLMHRLGPVLSARHLSRNLLKMLTLCYVGQENLLPDFSGNDDNLIAFTISDGRVVGDLNAARVLQCLTAISALYGDQFILLQYFPHVSELIALCKKRITSSLEGGLISSLQFLKYLVPCLNDTTIMDQLHDVILKSIIHPIIRLLASSRCLMPGGFLARSVLARKLLDAIYVLAVRIGPEMTKEHLCVPALQRFFLIFDKAYGISDYFKNDENEPSPSNSSDDSNFIEIRRDGGSREWCIKGSPVQISHAKKKGDGSMYSITPPINSNENSPLTILREKALEEICDVFTPNLAHVSYVPFLKYLGEHVMSQIVKNLSLILNLCHEYEQPNYISPERSRENLRLERSDKDKDEDIVDSAFSNSFGTAVIGNRIDVHQQDEKTEMGAMELLDFVTYKYEQINTARHLRGNWLAYWEHEIGRPEKDSHFNLKQIKLQTYAGHSNSVRSLLCLDNENSFMSASKDKTVKLWSLRSEGDGTKVSFCQFSYTNHRKSVHSLAFLESLRLTISCDSGVHLWDPFVGTQIGQLDSHKLTPVSVVKTYPAPSPLVLAGTAESTLKIIDARTYTYVNEWKVSASSSGSVRCIAVAPSGSWIAVGLSSGQLTLFDGRTGIIISTWKATDGELLQLNAPNDQQIISSSLDHNICVWSSLDGSLLYQMKSPAEPAHCILSNGRELLFGTPANRIGIYPSISPDVPYSITKLRSETFRGVLTSLALLPLNRMLLIGGDSGNISLLC